MIYKIKVQESVPSEETALGEDVVGEIFTTYAKEDAIVYITDGGGKPLKGVKFTESHLITFKGDYKIYRMHSIESV